MGVSRPTVERSEKYVEALDVAEEYFPGITRDIQSGKIRATHDEMLTIGKASPEKRTCRLLICSNL